MAPEQLLRLSLLRMALDAGACIDCAADVAAEWEAFVVDGDDHDEDFDDGGPYNEGGPLPDSLTDCLRSPWGRAQSEAVH